MDAGPAVGIDLGTTYSAVAVVDGGGRPMVLRNAEGKTLTPSVVAPHEGSMLVGDAAKELQALGEEAAAFFKRAIGNPGWRFEALGRPWSATDLSALVLAKLKRDAEAALKAPVRDAVVTVPAYFNHHQREATRAAGEAAGLHVRMVLNEPTAAALAYGMGAELHGKVLVYDLGGGTFDVTLMDVKPDRLDVLATDGDHELGGKDWDDRVAAHAASLFGRDHGVNPLSLPGVRNDLVAAAEAAKVALSSASSARIAIHHAGTRAAYAITRAEFERMTTDLLERTTLLAEGVLASKGVAWSDLAGVLLVGGSTRMPMVHGLVRRRSGSPPLRGVDVDEAVALGAALQARRLHAPRLGGAPFVPRLRTFADVTAHALGMIALREDRSRYVNDVILQRNLPIPARKARPFRLRTSRTGPNRMEIYVTQGETERPEDCVFVGKYVAEGVGHAEGGEVLIDVTYAYDASGLVEVEARRQSDGAPLAIRREPVPDDMSWVSRPPERPGAAPPRSVMLVLDVSSSMASQGLAEAKKAAGRFMQRTDASACSVGLVSFGSHARLECPLGAGGLRMSAAIAALRAGGSTDLAGGLAIARAQLGRAQGERLLLVLTDGRPNSEAAVLAERARCVAQEVRIIAIGTSGAREDFLKRLATDPEDGLLVRAGSVEDAFGAIAERIREGR